MPAVALDNLIADVPVDASIEQALSPVVNPIVQYIVSTPALAIPVAKLLGVDSKLVGPPPQRNHPYLPAVPANACPAAICGGWLCSALA